MTFVKEIFLEHNMRLGKAELSLTKRRSLAEAGICKDFNI